MLRENMALQLSKLFQILQNTGRPPPVFACISLCVKRGFGCLRVGDQSGPQWVDRKRLQQLSSCEVGFMIFEGCLEMDQNPDRVVCRDKHARHQVSHPSLLALTVLTHPYEHIWFLPVTKDRKKR
jgi:hypothetical protein